MTSETKITQEWMTDRVTYVFGEEYLTYTRKVSKFIRTSSITYESIAFQDTYDTSSVSHGAVVIATSVWVIISVSLIHSMQNIVTYSISASLLCIILVLLRAGMLNLTMTCFPLFAPASAMVGGPIAVFKRKRSDAILKELETRWRSAMRRRYFNIDPTMDVASTKAKLAKLHELRVIDKRELESAIASLAFQQTAFTNHDNSKTLN